MIERMWVNQPSTMQPYHLLHGVNVLARHEFDDTLEIFFLYGKEISLYADRLVLSPGWLTHATVYQDIDDRVSKQRVVNIRRIFECK